MLRRRKTPPTNEPSNHRQHELYESDIEKRSEERRLFRRKKREQERRECEEIEMYANTNQARKFYEKLKRQANGLNVGASSCKDKNGNLVVNPQETLRLWREHFCNLLAGGDDEHSALDEML